MFGNLQLIKLNYYDVIGMEGGKSSCWGITTLKFQVGKWVLGHITVKANENFTNRYLQEQKILNSITRFFIRMKMDKCGYG